MKFIRSLVQAAFMTSEGLRMAVFTLFKRRFSQRTQQLTISQPAQRAKALPPVLAWNPPLSGLQSNPLDLSYQLGLVVPAVQYFGVSVNLPHYAHTWTGTRNCPSQSLRWVDRGARRSRLPPPLPAPEAPELAPPTSTALTGDGRGDPP